jgi:hypothetical protein
MEQYLPSITSSNSCTPKYNRSSPTSFRSLNVQLTPVKLRLAPFIPPLFTLHSRPSLRRPSPFIPPVSTVHSATVHSPPSLRRTALHRPSLPHHLPPFAVPPFTRLSAALHPSLPHPSSPFTHSVALHPSFRLSSPLTPPPFTPALHRAALYPSFCRSLPFTSLPRLFFFLLTAVLSDS